MRHFLTILLFALSVASPAWAVEPLPAPKPGADTTAAVDTKATSDSTANDEHKSKKHAKKKRSKIDDDLDNLDDADANGAKPETDGLLFQGDKRIKMLMYDETDVYTITTRYGYQTNIIFSPQEEIELISVGDRSLWQIIPTGNRMFIRPMEEDVVTNMTVLTNKHSYQFDLKSLPADKTGNIYVAQFVYPGPKTAPSVGNMPPPPGMIPPLAMPAMPSLPPSSSPFGVGPSVPNHTPVVSDAPPAYPTQPNQPVPLTPETPAPHVVAQVSPASSATANYSYTYSGPDELAPLQVYDDGHSTYLKYRNADTLTPTVFAVDPSGKETPVSYSIKGNYMVVDAVAGELAVKKNETVVHVFNEMLNPG